MVRLHNELGEQMRNKMFSIGSRIYLSLEKAMSIRQVDGVKFYRPLARSDESLLLEVSR